MLGLLALAASASAASYPLATDYSGSHFFNGWIFNNTYDSLTNGDAVYVNYTYASAHQMAYLQNDQAIISVDNFTNVLYNDKRDTIKMTSTSQYGVNSVFVMDAAHLPFGCSVWPSFWTQGTKWPEDGEMDIMEAVNLQTANSYALHTSANSGCVASAASQQSGTISNGQTACSTTTGKTSGCVITESQDNSYGAGFAQNGGGVFAAELTASAIKMWFFPRQSIPSGLTSNASSIDTSGWGTPSANFASGGTCNIGKEFGFQSVILDITLCGDFAGAPSVYNATCQATRPGLCYTANVIGAGTNYDDAYFAINYVRIYSSNVTMEQNTASSNATGVNATATPALAAANTTIADSPTSSKSGASTLLAPLVTALIAALGLAVLYS